MHFRISTSCLECYTLHVLFVLLIIPSDSMITLNKKSEWWDNSKKTQSKEAFEILQTCCRYCPETFYDNAYSFLEMNSSPSYDWSNPTHEMLRRSRPCCPVCFENFSTPEAGGMESYLETHENIRRGQLNHLNHLNRRNQQNQQKSMQRNTIGSKTSGIFSKKLSINKNVYTCCTICPVDHIFLEIENTIKNKNKEKRMSFKALESTYSEDSISNIPGENLEGDGVLLKMTLKNGCCNQCPAILMESPLTRLEEPQGGPFGVGPRVTMPNDFLD